LLRYGKNKPISNKKALRNKRIYWNKILKKISFQYKRRVNLTKLKTLIYIPTFWSKTILNPLSNKDYLILYLSSDFYFFKFFFKKDYLKWNLDLNSNTVILKTYFEPFFKNFFLTIFKKLFQSFSYWFYTKLKIKGKGYYVYKNYRNTLTHQLGHSHRRYIYAYYVYMKFLSKTVIYLAGLSKNDLLLIGRTLQKSKYINIFTGRGVRFIKQVIYKKTGKVSSYR
jgi:hypothetical protein